MTEQIIDCTDLDLDSYARFLRAKADPSMRVEGRMVRTSGTRVAPEVREAVTLHEPHLFDYQRFIVSLAVEKQRFAVFANCGLGKTAIGLAWIRRILPAIPGRKVLIIAPLAVVGQWLDEEERFYGDDVLLTDIHRGDVAAWARDPESPPVAITNHDKFHEAHDLGDAVGAVLLDESSILKDGTSATRNALVETFANVPYRLALSATPAPNDREEYGNHATFLGYTRSNNEFLSMFFVNRDNGWELKPHGMQHFYRYLAGWSIYINDPSAYGFADNLKDLPEIRFHEHSVPLTFEQDCLTDDAPPGTEAMKRRIYLNKLSKGFLNDNSLVPTNKVDAIAGLIGDRPTIVWVEYNKEDDILHKALKERGFRVASISGSTKEEDRTRYVQQLRSGELQVLISKPRILGFGLNLQFVTNQIWSGLTDSYEQFYQAIKRSHRYGATEPIDVHLPMTVHEAAVLANIQSKKATFEEDMARQQAAFVANQKGLVEDFNGGRPFDGLSTGSATQEYPDSWEGDKWRILRGDSTVMLRELEPESVDLAVFSPPFASLFTYSDDIADMGNCGDGEDEFRLHFAYFLQGLYQALKPGRIVCCHVSQLATLKYRDGFVGVKDFRGSVIRSFQDAGFHFFGEWAIAKNPQMQAIKEKVRTLAFAQLNSDRLGSRPGFSDFILIMKKPGEADVKLASPDGPTNDEWIEWACGIWTGINESFTLNSNWAKSEDDVKHVCPFNLEVVDRCIRMYSGPGDLVLDPFNGIGSTGVVARGRGRKYLGIELKPEYAADAARNINAAHEAGLPPIEELRKAVAARRKAAKDASTKKKRPTASPTEEPAPTPSAGLLPTTPTALLDAAAEAST